MGKILTISIAAYNIEKFIGRTLNSFLSDEIIDDIEVLVIDDGGIDNSLQIASEYQKKYPNTIFPIHKENGGYGSVLNTAIKIAKGKYFKQLDGDDTLVTENLIKVVKLLKQLDVDYFFNPMVNVYEVSNKSILQNPYSNYEEGLYEMDEIIPTKVVTMHESIFKLDCLKKLDGEVTEHCFYTDVELIVRAMHNLETAYICNLPLYEYHIGIAEQSMSVAGVRKNYLDHEKVFWVLSDFQKKLNYLGEGRQKILDLRIRKEAAMCYLFICALPLSKENKQKLLVFDKNLKNNNYKLRELASEESKMVKSMILTNFLTYPLVHIRFTNSLKG